MAQASHPSSLGSGASTARRPLTLSRLVQIATPFLFMLPALLLVGVFFIWSFFRNIYLSLTDAQGARPPAFIGFDNYVRLFNDPILADSVTNTLYWVAGTIILPVGLGLLIAVVSYGIRGGAGYRLPFLIPYALSGTALATLWQYLLNTDGAINAALGSVGLDSLERAWLLSPPMNTISMIVASTWQGVGVSVLLFIVGLQTIPQDPIEAARLDGAEGWRLFRDMTLPLLRPMMIVIIGISLVNSLKTFDIIWIMTQGGPYRSSETLAVTMYRETFVLFRTGYGAAIAVTLSLIVIVVSWFYLQRTLRSV